MSALVADKLDEARALIERGWCQRASAKDAAGAIAPFSEACQFCAYGAVNAVAGGELAGEMLNALDDVVGRSIIGFNDAPQRTQADVIKAFRKAAEIARGGMGVSHG